MARRGYIDTRQRHLFAGPKVEKENPPADEPLAETTESEGSPTTSLQEVCDGERQHDYPD